VAVATLGESKPDCTDYLERDRKQHLTNPLGPGIISGSAFEAACPAPTLNRSIILEPFIVLLPAHSDTRNPTNCQ
jgi:hypothetical protein